MSKYEKHQREYTVLGATALLKSILDDQVQSFFGACLSEIVSVVKDGVYYHLQIEGDRQQTAKKFLQRVNRGEIVLEKEYKNFIKIVENYENFISQSESNFSLDTIVRLFKYYDDLMPVALAALDSLDVIHELSQEKKDSFTKWATKVRAKEEVIYKNGEMKFMPRFLSWLSQNHLPNYTSDDLKYLVYTEILGFVNNKKILPSLEDLAERKKLFFVRQEPLDKIEYFIGEEAQQKINEVKVFSQTSDNYENIKELKGTVAFAGKVSGRVRIIRSRIDLPEFKDGEIIVSPMTDPSYLPIMKRALAFVTNEGGTLCHAAIVARELQKPCIIGTKIATHVFKDGDLVEVDATSGFIKKI